MKLRLALVAMLGAVLAILATQARFTVDIAGLLPDGGDTAEALAAARAFGVDGTLLFAVDGDGLDLAAHTRAVGALAGALEAIDGMGDVRAGYSLEEAATIRAAAHPHAAALIGAPELQARLSPAGLRASFERQLARLSGPAGALIARQFDRDPLDLDTLALETLRGPTRMSGRGGLITDPTGRWALLVARPDLPVTNVGPDSAFVTAIEAAVADAAAPVAWYGGHRFAGATATSIAGDVRIASIVGGIALLVVLVVGFRSPRPILGAVVPVGVVALGGLAGAALVSPVHLLTVAFASALVGMGIDYWLHLYLVASTGPGATFADRLGRGRAAVRELLPAIALSAGSTALAFAALLTTTTPAVRVLGVVGLVAIGAAFVATAALGPFVYALVGPRDPPGARARRRVAPWLGAVAAVAVALVALPAGNAWFEADPMALLARSEALDRDAEVFAAAFDVSDRRAMILVEGEQSAVLDRAGRLHRALATTGFIPRGPATLVPGPEAIAERAAVVPPVDALQARIDAAAADVGFAPIPGAAAAVHASLAPPDAATWDATSLAAERDASLRTGEPARALLTLSLPSPNVVPGLEDTVRATDPAARWLVPSQLAARTLDASRADLLSRGAVAVLGVLVLLFLRFRRFDRVLAAAAPPLAGLVAASGLLAWTGQSWNLVNQAVAVLVLGLGLDYGVFVVDAMHRRDAGAATHRAVLLGAVTTVVGFAPLLLTTAPALTGIGVVVTAGVGTAAVVALVIVPWLAADARGRAAAFTVAFVAVAGLSVDLLYNEVMALTPPVARPVAPTHQLSGTPGDRRFGPNRLVRAEGVWTLATEGGPYDAGYALGALADDLRNRLEDELFIQFATHVPNPGARWLVTRGAQLAGPPLHRAIDRDLLVEVQGSSDAVPDALWLSGPKYQRKVYYHAIHDLGQALVDTPLLGCTGFIAGAGATADGHWLLGRNFDFDGGVAFDRDKIVRIHRPADGHAFLSVAFAGFVGAVSGVNEDGLAVAINAAGSEAWIRPSTPMTLTVRRILQHASTLDEAEALLDAERGFVAENVMVVDGDAGEAALFEVDPDRVVRVPVVTSIAVANHFRSPVFADDATNVGRQVELTTVPRQRRMQELLDRHRGDLDLAVAVDVLTDHLGVGDAPLPLGHRHALDAALSTHSFLVDATTRTVLVSRYPSPAGGYVRYDLAAALAGDVVPTSFTPAADVAAAVRIRDGRELLRAARRTSGASAVRLARQALAMMPGHPEPLFELGRALIAQGRADEGRPLLEQALAVPLEYAHQEREARALLQDSP